MALPAQYDPSIRVSSAERSLLLVDGEEGPLMALGMQMIALGWNVRLAGGPAVMQSLLQQHPEIAVVVIDDSLGRKAATRLVTQAKTRFPGLRVIWCVDEPARISDLSMVPPDLTVSGPRVAAILEERIMLLLGEDPYPEFVVSTLVEAARSSVQEVFGAEIGIGDPFLRTQDTSEQEIAALMRFCGDQIAGYVLTSGDCAFFSDLYALVDPDDLSDPVDTAGEIANVVAGKVKNVFAERNLSYALGLPQYIGRGTHVDHGSAPALVIPMMWGGRRGFIEFALLVCNRTRLSGTDNSLLRRLTAA